MNGKDTRTRRILPTAVLISALALGHPPSARERLNIGYKDGLKIESVNKDHKLRIGTETYTQFSALPKDAHAGGNFLLRRGRVTFQGRLFRASLAR